jgi:hypothetical protein
MQQRLPYYGYEMQRYLCSDLIALRTEEGESFVNLEEIWSSGAVFECERPMEPGSKIEMHGGESRFHGTIKGVEFHDFGCRVEVEFSPLTLWSPERFTPRHLLDLTRLKLADDED